MFDSYPVAVDFISFGLSRNRLFTLLAGFFQQKDFSPWASCSLPGIRNNNIDSFVILSVVLCICAERHSRSGTTKLLSVR